jgi:AraC-like DNA-binding protein
MDAFGRLMETIDQLKALDGYQYVAGSRQPVTMPSDIRIIVRKRRASELGSAVHDQFSLVVALRTAGMVQLDGHQVRLQAGEALLIMPGQVHSYLDIEDRDVHWLIYGFHLHDGEAWDELRSTPVAVTSRMIDDLASMLTDHFIDSGRGKRRTAHSERLVAMRLRLTLEQMLAARTDSATHIDGTGDGERVDATNPFVQRVVSHVRDHLADRLSIEAIARALHISPGHLRNEFHRLTGVGIGRYVRTARIRNACILLDTTDLPLTEVGRRSGYESIFSFSRAFKADKGIPPTAYRRTLKPVK